MRKNPKKIKPRFINLNPLAPRFMLSPLLKQLSEQFSFDIDLDKVEVKFPEGVESKLEVGDSLYLTLKYPPVSLYTNSEFFNLDDTKIFETVVQASMDKIYEGDKLYDCKQQTKEELQEFIDSIPAKQFEQIQNFLTNIPSLFYEIKYSNSKGTERVIQLQTLEDFFTFG